MLREITAFITAIAVDDRRPRSARRAVSALLHDPATSFVLVTSPRREAVEEAIAFAAELERSAARASALVVNRVHTRRRDGDGDLGDLDPLLGARLAGLVRESVAELGAVAAADGLALARLRAAFPALGPSPSPSCRSRSTTSPGCGGSRAPGLPRLVEQRGVALGGAVVVERRRVVAPSRRSAGMRCTRSSPLGSGSPCSHSSESASSTRSAAGARR